MRARACPASARGEAGSGSAAFLQQRVQQAAPSGGRAGLSVANRPAAWKPRIRAPAPAAVSTELERRASAALVLEPPSTRSPAEEATVRDANGAAEFQQVAWLRARAYFEAKPAGRFQGSFTKQFAEQEARSLLSRTQPAIGGTVPEAACLVATRDKGEATVLATADVRPPARAGGCYPAGVPQGQSEDPEGAFIVNVVVDSRWRRTGLGRLIMQAAEQHAAKRWGAKRAYAHVSLSNKAAWQLYAGLGYEAYGGPNNGGAAPGDVLLCKVLS